MSVRRLTPPGTGGVAVVEVSGSSHVRRLENLLTGPLPAVGRATLMRLAGEGSGNPSHPDAAGWMDEALVLRRGPAWVELCMHGNPLLVNALIAGLEAEGEQAARGSSVSVESEAWNRLPHIESEWGARIVLDQAQGALRREALAWARGESPGPASWTDLQARSAALLKPPLVVLTGASNAGKSTLFNLLVGEERVVVSSEEGTTLDTISAKLVLGYWVIQLVDTAGSRALPAASSGSPESDGQRLARDLCARADLVVELVAYDSLAGSEWPDPEPSSGRRVLVSRADVLGDALLDGSNRQAFSVKCAPDPARALVGEVILAGLGCRTDDVPWSAGRAVPLEAWRAQALEEARRWPAGAAREQHVLRVLDGSTLRGLPEDGSSCSTGSVPVE